MNIAINKLINNSNQDKDFTKTKSEFGLFTKTFCSESNLSSIGQYQNYFSLFYLPSNVDSFNFSNKTQPVQPLNFQNIKQPGFQIKLDDKKSPINTIKMNINLSLMQIPKIEEQVEKINKAEFSKICSEILPNFLYLSGQDVSSNIDILKENKITHIINAAAEICESFFSNEMKYLNLYLRDQANEVSIYIYYLYFRILNAASIVLMTSLKMQKIIMEEF